MVAGSLISFSNDKEIITQCGNPDHMGLNPKFSKCWSMLQLLGQIVVIPLESGIE